jgi:uncharacterized repeat protein (TIGR02543 family)
MKNKLSLTVRTKLSLFVTVLSNLVLFFALIKNTYDNNIIEAAALEYTVIEFSGVGESTWIAPPGVTQVEYLVVGGGGGGGTGYDRAGGGGGAAGMVLTGTLEVIPNESYQIEVGAGGAGGANERASNSGANGEDSKFHTIVAIGGIGGQGARTTSPTARYTGGSAQVNDVTPAQPGGFGGGAGSGGGGGGATGSGGNGSGTTGGTGGAGLVSSITGSSVTYGIGGAGGGYDTNTSGANGIDNRGNGGGAGGSISSSSAGGGTGGLGFVVLRYTTSYTVAFDPNSGSGTISDTLVNPGNSITLPSEGFTRDGFVLTRFNTQANGEGTSYDLGETITPTSSLTLFAQWIPTIDRYDSGIIRIDKTKVEEDLTNFPLTIVLNSGNFDFSLIQSSGADVFFTDTNDNLLPFEVDYFNYLSGIAVYHVLYSGVITSGIENQDILIRYGQVSGHSYDYINGYLPSEVWKNGYQSVYHFNDFNDSGPANRHLTSSSEDNQITSAEGLLGPSLNITTTSGFLYNSGSFDFTSGAMSLFMLLKPTGTLNINNWDFLVTEWFNTNGTDTITNPVHSFHYSLKVNNQQNLHTIGGLIDQQSSTVITSGAIYQLGFAIDSAGYQFFYDGNSDGSGITNSFSPRTTNSYLIIGDFRPDTNTVVGFYDELRISNVRRSVAWNKAEFYSTKGEFAKPVYTVSYETNGGTSFASISGEAGSGITSVTTRTGYDFAGWYTDSGLTNPAAEPFIIPVGGATLYAKWTVPQLITSGLMIHLDASSPGSNPSALWEDLVNDYDFLVKGGAVYQSPGFYSFNGIDGYLVSNGTIQDTVNTTIEMWVNVPSDTGVLVAQRSYIDVDSNGASSIGSWRYSKLEVQNNDSVGARIWSSASIAATDDFDRTDWNHIVYTYDGDILRLYVNGVLEASGDLDRQTRNDERLTLFAGIDVSNMTDLPSLTDRSFLAGSISQFRVYDRALSANEVSQNFYAGQGVGFPSPQVERDFIYQTMTIPASDIDDDLVNFPLTVVLDDSNFDFTGITMSGIYFTDTAHRLLDFEVDSVSSNSGIFHVRVPFVSSGVDTTIWVRHSSTVDYTNGRNPSDVWDENYLFVSHMGQGIPNSASSTEALQIHNITFGSGLLGDVALFNESYVRLPSSLNTTNFTKVAVFTTTEVDERNYNLITGSTSKPFYFFDNRLRMKMGTHGVITLGTGSITTNNQHVAFSRFDEDGSFLRLDTYSVQIAQNTGSASNNEEIYLGVYDASFTGPLKGTMDEVRISDIGRSDAWIKAEYLSLTNMLINYSGVTPLVNDIIDPVNLIVGTSSQTDVTSGFVVDGFIDPVTTLSGVVDFDTVGSYPVYLISVDDANNQSIASLNVNIVLPTISYAGDFIALDTISVSSGTTLTAPIQPSANQL